MGPGPRRLAAKPRTSDGQRLAMGIAGTNIFRWYFHAGDIAGEYKQTAATVGPMMAPVNSLPHIVRRAEGKFAGYAQA